MPVASIIVPAFNASATLVETLESLLAQSHRDVEIVVVDDGSFDRTADIVRQHARDPRIRLVQQANRGLAGARNSGIAAARGTYIGFCDADDLWHPEKLATHVRHLEASPDVGLSFSASELIDEDSRAIGLAQQPRLTGITAAHVLKRNPIGNGSAVVARREALEAIAYRPVFEGERHWIFDETFRQSEDIECWLRLMLTTDWQIEGVPGQLTSYRVSASGLSSGLDRQLGSWERMIEKLRPLNPALFERHEAAARAYQLRYLARRAISAGDGARALSLVRDMLAQSSRPWVEEPAKTIVTAVAAVALSCGGTRLLRAGMNLNARLRTTVGRENAQ